MLGYLSANSALEENCELRGTDNVQGKISEHIFAPNGGYCLLSFMSFSQRAHAVLKIGGYSKISPSFSWGIFGHVTCLDQSRASEHVQWTINISILFGTSFRLVVVL